MLTPPDSKSGQTFPLPISLRSITSWFLRLRSFSSTNTDGSTCNYILSLSKPKTTTVGLNSSSYFSAKQWNALSDFFRTSFFLQITLRPKYRMLPSCRFFLFVLELRIVNNILFYLMCLLLLLLLLYYYL